MASGERYAVASTDSHLRRWAWAALSLLLIALETNCWPFGGMSAVAQSSLSGAANTGLPSRAEGGIHDFDGSYFSPKWKYGFRIENGVGTATVSNSPKYKLGDVILRFAAAGPGTFIGEQICTDGVFHPTSGTLARDGDLDIVVFGCGSIENARWKMVKTEGGSGIATAASEEPKGVLAEAEGGALWAQYALGASYLSGQGNPRDVGEALKWLSQAAEAGYLEAQLAIGNMYYSGDGVPKDRPTALAWFRRIADEADRPTPTIDSKNAPMFIVRPQAIAFSEFFIGTFYHDGADMPVDYAEARRWFAKSAAHGQPVAQEFLAEYLYNGRGGPADYVEARRLYLIAAQQGFAPAQNNLAVMMETGRGGFQDPVMAFPWYLKSAEQGYDVGQSNVGAAYYEANGVRRDYVAARKWFALAAEQGNPVAERALATMFYDGKGGVRDNREARRWFLKSAEAGEDLAQAVLGVMLNEGIGGRVDRAEAVRWLQFAAKLGNDDARTYLRNIIHDVVYPSPELKNCVAQCRSEDRGMRDTRLCRRLYDDENVRYEGCKIQSDKCDKLHRCASHMHPQVLTANQ